MHGFFVFDRVYHLRAFARGAALWTLAVGVFLDYGGINPALGAWRLLNCVIRRVEMLFWA